jgi:hypothetical protein
MGWQQREQGGMNGSTASVASSGSASKKPQRASPTNPPGHQPSQRILILQKILREHQQWLNTPSPPSDDFGDPSLKWCVGGTLVCPSTWITSHHQGMFNSVVTPPCYAYADVDFHAGERAQARACVVEGSVVTLWNVQVLG